MLNEKRVKHMVKLASYEAKNGAEEIKINSFFRKDYVSYNVLITLIWITLGYLSFAGLLCLGFLKEILANLSFSSIVILVVAIVAGILIWAGTRPYEVLFTELNSTEMSSILNYMEQQGVTDYKVENSDTILVKESQVNSLKVRLLILK